MSNSPVEESREVEESHVSNVLCHVTDLVVTKKREGEKDMIGYHI